jgi:hypothetical protein
LTASENVDPETLNFDYSDGNDLLYFCLWANLSHNPRIKDFAFAKKGLSFSLPRPLTLAHVAVQSLFTNFDLLSPKSRTFVCKAKRDKFDFGK